MTSLPPGWFEVGILGGVGRRVMHDPVGFSTVLLRNAVGTLPKDLAVVFTTVTTNDGDPVVVQIFFADQWEIKPCGVITHERLGFVGENTATSAV